MITPKYRNDLDGLRGLACIMAVMFHAYPAVLTGGYIGVEIFFVVSGFLIGTIVLQSTGNGTFSYADFYSRRIRRIFPALVVMLAGVAMAGWFLLLTSEYQHVGKHILAGAGFVSNLAHWSEVNYFDVAAETKPFLHLWSLGVEEQFYIFLPPLLLLAARLRFNVRVVFGVLWLGSYAFNLYLTAVDRTAAFYSPLPRLWELFTGCMLASLFLDPPRWSQPLQKWRNSPWLVDGIALAGMALIVVPMLMLDRESYFPGGWTTLPVTGTALLIAVGAHSRFSHYVLSHGSITWVGRISYPLYLWHWPLLSIAQIIEGAVPPPETRALLIAAAVLLSVITYHVVEQPMRFGRLRRPAVPLVSALLVVVAAAGALIWQGDILKFRGMGQREAMVMNSTMTNIVVDREYALPDCTAHPAVGEHAARYCREMNLHQQGPLLVLWGDSHVRGWRPVFVQLARERGLRLVIFDHPGCSPLLNVWRKGFYCDPAITEDIARSIRALGADQVVLISQWDVFANGVTTTTTARSETYYLTERKDGDADGDSSRATFARQFPATVQRLRDDGARVLVFKAPPMLNAASAAGFVRHPDALEPTLAVHLERTAFTRQYIDALAGQPGVDVFDLAPVLCDEKCRASNDEFLLYADENHLTAMACMLFKSRVGEVVIDPREVGAR